MSQKDLVCPICHSTIEAIQENQDCFIISKLDRQAKPTWSSLYFKVRCTANIEHAWNIHYRPDVIDAVEAFLDEYEHEAGKE
jgi:hypothetical protein